MLDTNRYTDLQRGEPSVVGLLEAVDELLIPFVVVAEIRVGYSLGRRARENELYLTRFLSQPHVTVLLPDLQTINGYAALYRQLRQQGTPIPHHDVWIAALALQHDAALYSRDGRFEVIPQLRLI
ncbi:MAG TPA: type II toxin-antitoxin system VapC family toxin [Tepidisphaeraceae bacterium]